MKNTLRIFTAAVVLLMMACNTGARGSAGPPGAAGAAGPQGVSGNADPAQVVLNSFGSSGAAAQPAASFNISGDGIVGGSLKSPMWSTTTLFEGAGPLPVVLDGGFVTHGGTAQFFVSGSAYSGVVSHTAGIELDVDGVRIGVMNFFFNLAGTHQSFPAHTFTASLAAGTHSLTLKLPTGLTDAGVTTDSKDVFQVVLTELPF